MLRGDFSRMFGKGISFLLPSTVSDSDDDKKEDSGLLYYPDEEGDVHNDSKC